MSTKNKEQIDVNELNRNLKDLNDISKRIITEFEETNKILVGGLRDCKNCSADIKKRQNNKSANY
jgi:hypothetical protein